MLGSLVADGYLARRVDNPAGSGSNPGAVASAGAAAANPHALLIALVREQFGAHAPRLVQKIEQHPDTPEGRAAAIEACVRFIRLFIDEKQASAFAQRAQELLLH